MAAGTTFPSLVRSLLDETAGADIDYQSMQADFWTYVLGERRNTSGFAGEGVAGLDRLGYLAISGLTVQVGLRPKRRCWLLRWFLRDEGDRYEVVPFEQASMVLDLRVERGARGAFLSEAELLPQGRTTSALVLSEER